jgi:hypothetical protein
VDPELLEGIRLCVLDGVREYTDGDPVELRRDPRTGRLMVVAWNECHNNLTRIDLFDLIDWLRSGPPQYRVEGGFTIPASQDSE